MKAMILAAGRGQRMMPLTASLAKPMLEVKRKPLIVYHIERLAQAGIVDIVINLAWCGETIEDYLSDGSQYGVSISYSRELEGGLETAGGIINALDKLSDEFIVINGDIYTDYDVSSLTQLSLLPHQAHIVLVENPVHHSMGDFAMKQGFANLGEDGEPRHTFSGIALYHKTFFANIPNDYLALGPLLRDKMSDQLVTAELYLGVWHDIGTPERLSAINKMESQA